MELLCSRLLLALVWLLTAASCSPAPADPLQSTRGRSPEDLGLKAEPTDDYSFPHIAEHPGKQYDPRPQDLNVSALRERLGRHFDAEYMSVGKPRHNQSSAAVDFPFKTKRNRGRDRLVPVGDMPHFLRKTNFKSIRLPDGSRLKTHVTAKLQKKMQHFLWAYTACPVVHTWRDLGVRYWPRYVKKGNCPAGKVSCSIPPGMKCQPSERTLKVILRWQCHDAHSSPLYSALAPVSAAPLQCQWIELKNYPIVTGCSCSCPSKGGS